MRTFGLWLLITFSLLNMSAMAVSSVDKINSVDHVYTLASLGEEQSAALQMGGSQCSSTTAYKQTDLPPLKKLSSQHTSYADLQSKVEAFADDKSSALYAAPDNVALREVSKAEPQYSLIAEFNPPDPAIKSIADYRFGKNDIPWFLSTTQRQRIKLCAWKDSNSLYRSKLHFYS